MSLRMQLLLLISLVKKGLLPHLNDDEEDL